MTVLVDSDVLIEVSRAKDQNIVSIWTELGQSDVPILYSPVSAAELWAGARPSEHDTIENLFRVLICVPVDSEIGRRAGEYLRQYRKSHGVELGDALIAAATSLRRAALWTRNRKHYPMKDVAFF